MAIYSKESPLVWGVLGTAHWPNKDNIEEDSRKNIRLAHRFVNNSH